ncbi:MAG: (2Fe-2S)-binding protein [Pseudonocardiales bacterium]|nr:MAG: (2Fe-2S)-binding protein [Pseudonocardiales bacterium]
MQPFDLIKRLEQAKPLDAIAEPAQGLVAKVVQPQALRDILHGVPIGHPAHPMLVQVPIGAWLSAALLDRVPGAEKGADTLVAAGIAAALPAALSGAVDFSDQHPEQARVGLVHAVSNTVSLALFAASLVARAGGRRRVGRRLALLGIGTLSVGGVLGGHISFHQAGGANHTEDVPHRVSPGWRPVCPLDDLGDGEPVRKMVDDVPVFVLRTGKTVAVLADLCSHLSAPLHEGEVTGSGPDRCVVCPWHGSTFRLADGAVVHGPATAPQPVFTVRIEGTMVEASLPGASG